MQIAVLGPTVVTVDGEPVDLGSRKQRAVLARSRRNAKCMANIPVMSTGPSGCRDLPRQAHL